MSTTRTTERRPNRLVHEKSPYLLQHAYNPVDWYPWADEAFDIARREDKPVFLSIGYSTCHWCHVMEHESFEDEEIAALMNDAFVCIKVDREERPDVDNVYMAVAQMLTGHGGWPLTILMTPNRDPFFAGTYFPKETRFGRVGMRELVPRLKTLWDERRSETLNSAGQIVSALSEQARAAGVPEPDAELGQPALDTAFQQLSANFDSLQGGFGGAPKFPTPHNLRFLLRYWDRAGDPAALGMVESTLAAMRRGGIYDHIGFGFHRYSTDARWMLPHFEKMLYDQALLALAYTDAFHATREDEYATTVKEIFAYVLRDLLDEGGAFHAAEDADSEGREGKFYLWTEDELREALEPEELDLVKQVYNVEGRGNFAEEATGRRTGENVLYLKEPVHGLAARLGLEPAALEERLAVARDKLFRIREGRVRPHKDDKILTDWNGLMIAALARGGAVLGEPQYVEAAARSADFIERELVDERGRLLHRYRDGEAAIPAYVDDYAFLTWGLLELYEASQDPRFLSRALRLTRELLELFWDEAGEGLYFAAGDAADELPVRTKEIYDGAVPSGNSVSMLNFLWLARLTGDPELEARAAAIERAFAAQVARAPLAHTQLMLAVDFRLGPTREIVIAGPHDHSETKRLLGVVREAFLPRAVVVLRDTTAEAPTIDDLVPYVAEMRPVDERPAAYVCSDFVCERPVTDVETLTDLLSSDPR